MEFTKEKTNIAKGVAISLMFIHHLYPFSERLINGNYYIPLVPFVDIENRIGFFGQICVSMFLFLSGYGMFVGYSHFDKSSFQYSLKKLKDFYQTYWVYFLIFVPMGFIFFREVTFWGTDEFRYIPTISDILIGFIGWSDRYNTEWWFVRMFLISLILLCPIYLSFAKRSPLLLFTISFCLFLVSWFFKVSPGGFCGFIFWQPSLATGIMYARCNFFESRSVQYFDRLKGSWFFLGLLFCFLIRHRYFSAYNPELDFLIVPFFIYSAVRVVDFLGFSKVFVCLGTYSFPMWLVHSFFCYYYFQDFIYFPRWSPLIFLLLILASLLTAVLVEHLCIHAKVLGLNIISKKIGTSLEE
jgi:hypothetical protein